MTITDSHLPLQTRAWYEIENSFRALTVFLAWLCVERDKRYEATWGELRKQHSIVLKEFK